MYLRWLIALFFVANLVTNEATKLKDWLDGHRPESESGGSDVGHGGKQVIGDKKETTGGLQKQIIHLNSSCSATQRKFVELGIGDASVTISAQIHDSDMAICYNGYKDTHRQSCCSHTMERLYQATSVKDYYRVLQTSSSYLYKLMVDNVLHYQELFLQLLESAHNKTDWLFSDVYHLPLMDRWGPTESLFLDLRAYLRQKDVSIHKSLETFFDQLFPLVFHNNVNDPRSSQISQDYRDCLVQVRKDIYPPPFGSVPGRFAHQLAQSFSSARAFLDALRMGVKVINRTRHMPLSGSCQVALTRMTYCGHCEGRVDVSPCRGLCYNVMRGCLAHVTDVNIHWNEMIDSLELLTVNMRGSYDIEEVLHSFHSKVSEAIMHAMETGVKFNSKVIQRCGHPKSIAVLPETESPQTAKPDTSAIIPIPLNSNTRLYAKIEMFMRNIIAAKGFLSHLPDTMCTEERFSAGVDGPCWNGDSVASYNKSIMTKDLAAQLQNPEVKVDKNQDPEFTELAKQLQTLKTLLRSKVNLDRMQGDAPQPAPQKDDPSVYYYAQNNDEPQHYDSWQYGSGDSWYKGYQGGYYGGYYGNGPMDDEDWRYGSGSGSGEGPGYSPPIRTSSRQPGVGHTPGRNDDITFDDTKKSNNPYISRTPQPGNNGAETSGSSAYTRNTGLGILFSVCCLLLSLVA